jgi:hypothetical protein
MEEGARVHHSYGSYAPSTYGSYMDLVKQIRALPGKKRPRGFKKRPMGFE